MLFLLVLLTPFIGFLNTNNALNYVKQNSNVSLIATFLQRIVGFRDNGDNSRLAIFFSNKSADSSETVTQLLLKADTSAFTGLKIFTEVNIRLNFTDDITYAIVFVSGLQDLTFVSEMLFRRNVKWSPRYKCIFCYNKYGRYKSSRIQKLY